MNRHRVEWYAVIAVAFIVAIAFIVFAAAAAMELITLHMLDGRVVQINPRHVTQLMSPIEGAPNKSLTEDVQCVVRLTDGTFISVVEDCDTVRELLEKKP